jgi:hypothetical protein
VARATLVLIEQWAEAGFLSEDTTEQRETCIEARALFCGESGQWVPGFRLDRWRRCGTGVTGDNQKGRHLSEPGPRRNGVGKTVSHDRCYQ